MNANELFIGAHVKFLGKERKIKSIITKDTGIEISFYGKNPVVVSLDEIEPIPLTPEILEKNGFKIDKNETYCKMYFFACNLGKIPQTVVEFYFYGEGVLADTLFKCWTKPESCDGENSIHICDLKYVHHFQHALRLCGIEKEIEL